MARSFPLKLAASTLMTIPVAILFFVFQRRIMNASAGAVKTPMAGITFDNVTKTYGDGFRAVSDLNLDVQGRRVRCSCRPIRVREVNCCYE